MRTTTHVTEVDQATQERGEQTMARLTLDEIEADREYSFGGVLKVAPDTDTYVLLGHFDAEAATRKLAEWMPDLLTLTDEVPV